VLYSTDKSSYTERVYTNKEENIAVNQYKEQEITKDKCYGGGDINMYKFIKDQWSSIGINDLCYLAKSADCPVQYIIEATFKKELKDDVNFALSSNLMRLTLEYQDGSVKFEPLCTWEGNRTFLPKDIKEDEMKLMVKTLNELVEDPKEYFFKPCIQARFAHILGTVKLMKAWT
jgi:hypothetical protein